MDILIIVSHLVSHFSLSLHLIIIMPIDLIIFHIQCLRLSLLLFIIFLRCLHEMKKKRKNEEDECDHTFLYPIFSFINLASIKIFLLLSKLIHTSKHKLDLNQTHSLKSDDDENLITFEALSMVLFPLINFSSSSLSFIIFMSSTHTNRYTLLLQLLTCWKTI